MESNSGVHESELFLQWGNRKRNRFPRTTTTTSTTTITREDRKTMSNGMLRSNANTKPDSNKHHIHHYTNRRGGGVGVEIINNNEKGKVVNNYVWPKLYLGLSDKEKEEDFLAMKGCKLPQRPKKRPKAIQKSLLLVCPGGWLADMYQDRYEIREKKSSKKRPGGLKAMGSLESESE